MIGFPHLDVAVLSAPMAGGPSTPELVAAVSNAGGLGILAGGYLSGQQFAQLVRDTRLLTPQPFGVNLFVPERANAAVAPGEKLGANATAAAHRASHVRAYREALVAAGDLVDEDSPEVDAHDDDAWDEKLASLVLDPVDLVTFTFGLPEAAVFETLHDSGTSVGVTVTSPEDAVAAATAGADFVVAQGWEAGGHRSTFRVSDTPNELCTVDLVLATRRVIGEVPIVAAGGVGTREQLRAVIDAGAIAAQIGTALLRSREAGTLAGHRAALGSDEYVRTTVTRAFSGRPARVLENEFVRRHADAPGVYPEVNQLTRSIRNRARLNNDADAMSLFAGTGWRSAKDLPAAEIVREIADGAGPRGN